ncbi:MAG TPA: TIGR03435 family protein [Vicinamibacterales bacterium]|nr:TIGR03435 family protein [Vicinamibacterales bacterium]
MQRNQGLTIAIFVALAAISVCAQQTFEVASIKRNTSGDPRSGTRTLPGGRVAIINLELRQVIRDAYGSKDLDVLGGPDWIDRDRWDINGSGGTGNADEPLEPMLKALLADRFKLRVHVEMQERPIYALVLARSDRRLGEKLHTSAIDCRPDADCGTSSGRTNGVISGTLTGAGRTMADIGRTLSRYAGRRVFDRTGVDGRYDFEVQWSEEVSIFTAVQEQLGLKLESQRGPVEVVVIDSVERPTED